MIIAIPSKGRAGQVPSQSFISSALLFVPAAEAEAYAAQGGKNIVVVPDDVKGITPTRNWIIRYVENFGERNLVFVDDDLIRCAYIKFNDRSTNHIELTAEQAQNEFLRLFAVTEDAKLRLWGVSTVAALRGTYTYKPFLFQSYITASCMGIIVDPDRLIQFDESFIVKEDYELCLRIIKEDGAILAARYFYWQNEHWETDGGCKAYRTKEIELGAIRRLIEKYPANVVHRPSVTSPYTIRLYF